MKIFLYEILNRTVSGFDYDTLEKTMKRIVKEEQPFERLEISKEDLLRLFGVCTNIYLFVLIN
jgi:threonyl-tRNA synthetase